MQSSRGHTKVQDLGLPDRWSNFTVFSSEVSRLVLLSERGRTHGSIWGVPPFLEGILRATVATTMTTSYFYSYIETTSYRTTYTVTVQLKQSRYSLMREWWESDDGYNWYKVTSSWGRREVEDCSRWWDRCDNILCHAYSCSRLTGGFPPLNPDRPVITYHRYNETLTLKPSQGYTLEGRSRGCYYDMDIGACVERYTEWGKTYKLQAIELVDWDTGEVHASVNQTSITFNIVRNTIARYKYVPKESWKREWIVILRPPPPPSPEPSQCQQILNDPNARCGNQWCYCLYHFDPEAWKKEECCQPKSYSCLSVSVDFCCSGDIQYSCLASRSGGGGRNCVEFTAAEKIQGVTKPLPPVSWSASWRLMGPWVYDRIIQVGNYNPPYCTARVSGNSASGECCIDRSCMSGNVGPNENYSTTVVIVFKKT
jgi:hypothetical protein